MIFTEGVSQKTSWFLDLEARRSPKGLCIHLEGCLKSASYQSFVDGPKVRYPIYLSMLSVCNMVASNCHYTSPTVLPHSFKCMFVLLEALDPFCIIHQLCSFSRNHLFRIFWHSDTSLMYANPLKTNLCYFLRSDFTSDLKSTEKSAETCITGAFAVQWCRLSLRPRESAKRKRKKKTVILEYYSTSAKADSCTPLFIFIITQRNILQILGPTICHAMDNEKNINPLLLTTGLGEKVWKPLLFIQILRESIWFHFFSLKLMWNPIKSLLLWLRA